METGHPVSISYLGILLTIFRNQTKKLQSRFKQDINRKPLLQKADKEIYHASQH